MTLKRSLAGISCEFVVHYSIHWTTNFVEIKNVLLYLFKASRSLFNIKEDHGVK